MKMFASHKQMKSESDLTCLQALDKDTIQSVNGKML